MKYTITGFLAASAFTVLTIAPPSFAATHKLPGAPVVIQMPAVQNGSNWSRAPFPAARPENDVTPPNGEAFDQDLPPNTPATTPAPFAPPPPVVAILQPRVAPGVLPTGRPTAAASAALAPAQLVPAIRNASFESRDDLLDGVRARQRQSEMAVAEFRRSESEMSGQGRSQFDAMRSDVKDREKALDRSIRAAAAASSADWDSARAQLAADYDAYAAAVGRMDATVGVRTVR